MLFVASDLGVGNQLTLLCCAVVQDSYFRHVPPVLQPYPLRLFHAEEFNMFGGCIYWT